MPEKNTARIELSGEAIGTPEGQRALARAVAVLRDGGTVAFATETVYGLGANALDASAVEKIFVAKGRPAWDPLIVHVSDAAMLERVAAEISLKAQRLIDAFWPGPLTLLLPRQQSLPSRVTAGRELVGVRMPSHPIAHALIAAADLPVAAPSANRFGHTSPTTAQHVLDDLDGAVDLVLDSGPAWSGVESTVIEVADSAIVLYRPGAIPAAEIEAIGGPVTVYRPPSDIAIKVNLEPESLPSPGVGIRHYAPDATIVLANLDIAGETILRERWLEAIRRHSGQPNLGVMVPTGWPLPEEFAGMQYAWGSWNDKRELARNLFAGLRALDAMGAEMIVCPMPAPDGLGAAIRDRLLKAAKKATPDEN